MSLTDRLKSLQREVPEPLTDLSHLTLADLQDEVINFGKQHKGHTFAEAWEDQAWISFMTARYSKSSDPNHRKLMRFIDLQVSHHEAHQLVIPVRAHPASRMDSGQIVGMPKSAAKAKAKAKSSMRTGAGTSSGYMHPIPLDEMTEAEMEEELGTYASPTTHALTEQPEFLAVQERLLNMENALTRVVRHLESQTTHQQNGQEQ